MKVILLVLCMVAAAQAIDWERKWLFGTGCADGVQYSKAFTPGGQCLQTANPAGSLQYDCGGKKGYRYTTSDCTGTPSATINLVNSCDKGPVDGIQMAWSDQCDTPRPTGIAMPEGFKSAVVRKYSTDNCLGDPIKVDGYNAGTCFDNSITYYCANVTIDAVPVLHFVKSEHFDPTGACNATAPTAIQLTKAHKCLTGGSGGSIYVECSWHTYNAATPAATLVSFIVVLALMLAAFL